MLEMYDDIDWMDEPTETGWMPAPEQVSTKSEVPQPTLRMGLGNLTCQHFARYDASMIFMMVAIANCKI